ncbi:MAG TPA: ROK family protein [Acidimicrobiales bacterium]|nr:ROK family protein [Acidimicrobiales bacterium]
MNEPDSHPDSSEEVVLGIDIGGSSVKAGRVAPGAGELVGARVRMELPRRPRPGPVLDMIVGTCAREGPVSRIGCTFPGVIERGRIRTAVNMGPEWTGLDLKSELEDRFASAWGRRVPVVTVNDADAAGVAEVRWGAARGTAGVVLAVTLGTGIGSALFTDGTLVPNTELGHIEIGGRDAETFAAARWRVEEDLTWEEWGSRVDLYLRRLEALIPAELIVVGGGVSEDFPLFAPYLHPASRVVPARFRNDAGIIGAAAVATSTDPERPARPTI